MPSVGSAYVTIRVNTKGFDAQLNKMMASLSKKMEKHGEQLGKDFTNGMAKAKPEKFFDRISAAADKSATKVKNASGRMGDALDSVGERGIDVGDVLEDVFSDVSEAAKRTAADVRSSGSAFTDLKNDARGTGDALGSIGDGGRRGGAGLRDGGNGANFFGRALQNIADVAPGANQMISTLFNYAAFGGTALAGVAGAASAAGSGIFAMASNAAAAAPALSILSNAAIAFAQVGVTIGVASKGVGEAITAGFEPATKAAKSASSATASIARAVAAAGRAVRDAKQNLQDAYAAAARAAEDAARRTKRAELDVASAQQVVLAAQRALNAARKEGLEQLEDIAFAAEDAALAEERAALNLEDAYAALQAVQSLPPDDKTRREAELAFKEADLQLRTARDRREDADRAAEQAAKTGVKGTEAVQDAQSNLANAQEAALDAQIALTDARREEGQVAEDNARRIRDAQQAVADAQQRLAEAQQRGADATANQTAEVDKYAEALKKLSPHQKAFVKYIISQGDTFSRARKQIADPLFDGLLDGLKTVMSSGLFDSLVDRLTGTSRVMGDLARRGAEAASKPPFSNRFNAVMKSNNKALTLFGNAGGNLAQVLVNLAFAARPLVMQLAKYIEKVTGAWKASQDSKKEIGELGDKVQTAGKRFREWWRFLVQIKNTLMILGGAANEAANNFDGISKNGKKSQGYIPSLTQSLKEFNDKLKKNREELVTFFDQSLKNFNAVGRAIKAVTDPLIKMGGDPNVEKAFDTLSKTDAFDTLGQTATDALPALAELVVQLADILAALSESGGIRVFLETLGGVAEIIATIVNLPGAGKILGVTAAIFGFWRALKLVKRVAFGLFGGIFGDVRKIGPNLAKARTTIGKSNASFKRSGTRIGNSFLLGFTSGMKGIAGEGKLVAKKAGTGLKAAFATENGKLRSAGVKSGHSFTQGFALGIKEGQIAVVAAARQAGIAAAKGINSAIQAKSPSRLSMRSGQNLALGMSIGIKAGTPAAAATATTSGRIIGRSMGKGTAIGVKTSTPLVKTASKGLGRAFSFALGPLFTIILVVELILPLLKKFYNKSEKFRTLVDSVWKPVKKAIEVVLPVLKDIGNALGDLVSEMASHKSIVIGVGAVVGLVLAGMIAGWIATATQATISAAKMAAAWIVQKIQAAASLAVTLVSFAAMIGGWIASAAAATASAITMAAAWLIALGPVGLIIAGIVAVVALLVVLWKRSETFKRIVTKAFTAVGNAAKAVFNWIKNNWKLILAILAGPFGLLVYIVIKKKDAILAIIKAIPGRVKEFLSNMWDFVSEKWSAAITSIKSVWNNKLVPFITGLPGQIKDKLAGIWDGLKSGFIDAAFWVTGKIQKYLLDPLNGILDKFGAGSIKITLPSKPAGYAAGGQVRGPGGPKGDKILARLSDREYVMPAGSAAKIGLANLEYMRKYGRMPRGGLLGDAWDGLKAGGSKLIGGIKSLGSALAKGAEFALTWVVDRFADQLPDNKISDMVVGILKSAAKNFLGFGKKQDEQEAAKEAVKAGTTISSPSGHQAFPIAGAYSYHSGYTYGARTSSGGYHTGSDFPAASGTPLVAMSGGRVRYRQDLGNRSYGRLVVVDYPTFSTLYAHMNSFAAAAQAGRKVTKGTPLGTVGAYGNASGPHLHIELSGPGGSFGSMSSTRDPAEFLRRLGFKFAKGGIAHPQEGGMLSVIAEAGKAERVEPLDREGFSKRDRKILELIEALINAKGGGSDVPPITVFPSRGMNEVELAKLVLRGIKFSSRRGS